VGRALPANNPLISLLVGGFPPAWERRPPPAHRLEACATDRMEEHARPFTEAGFFKRNLGKGGMMTTIKVGQARTKLGRLVDEAAASHEPILITGKRTNAVLLSEEDWRAIQETLYLLSIPGMRESIREGLQTPVGECTGEPDW